jgi:(p)ppGpp synthase/HD superfamily hydrolase
MYPDYKEEARLSSKKSGAANPKSTADTKASSAIPIRGINSDLPVKFAPNGGAVPGDRIVGIVTPGEGITIYPIQSPALKDFEEEPERWLDVRWDTDEATPRRFRRGCMCRMSTSRAVWRRLLRSSPSMTAISTTST